MEHAAKRGDGVVDAKRRNTRHDEEDDAERYALLMEEDPNYEKEMEIVEVDDEIAIKTCKMYNYKYTVVTPNDIIIPPKL